MIIPSQWTDWREHLQENAALAALTPQAYGFPVFEIACIISKAKDWTGIHGLRPSFKKSDLNTFEKSGLFSLNTFQKHSTNHGDCRRG